MKTNRELIQEALPKEFADLVIKRIEEDDAREEHRIGCDKLLTLNDKEPRLDLLELFVWNKTPEGFLFWDRVDSYVKKPTEYHLPTFPKG